jgi:hypothetical protein
MNEKEEIQALKEWALSTFVQKDACSNRHEASLSYTGWRSAIVHERNNGAWT